MLGFGTVGEGTYRMVRDNAESIGRRTGACVEFVRIGVRDLDKPRSAEASLFTKDLMDIADDDSIDVVLELIGGEHPAVEVVERCLNKGKHVVTANKELIAKHGSRLISLAKANHLDLHFEAAVGGGIPVVQALKHQLAGNDVIKLLGILNGTTNHILTQMAEQGRSFEDALREAQEAGYAEADPTNDVDGFDTMYKSAVLAAIVFGKQIPLEDVHREGIRSVTTEDLRFADVLGYAVKLLGVVEQTGDDRVLVRVHPALVPKSHQLASVKGVYNAVWVHGDFVGDLMFSGRGAGADPTASAVVGDLVDVLRNIVAGGQGSAIPYGTGAVVSSIDDLQTRYYLRLEVMDRPGTLGQITTEFGLEGVGLASMEMRPKPGGLGEIVLLTHTCREGDFRASLAKITALPVVSKLESWMRVEG
jgi:homoserine dehydrogenase